MAGGEDLTQGNNSPVEEMSETDKMNSPAPISHDSNSPSKPKSKNDNITEDNSSKASLTATEAVETQKEGSPESKSKSESEFESKKSESPRSSYITERFTKVFDSFTEDLMKEIHEINKKMDKAPNDET